MRAHSLMELREQFGSFSGMIREDAEDYLLWLMDLKRKRVRDCIVVLFCHVGCSKSAIETWHSIFEDLAASTNKIFDQKELVVPLIDRLETQLGSGNDIVWCLALTKGSSTKMNAELAQKLQGILERQPFPCHVGFGDSVSAAFASLAIAPQISMQARHCDNLQRVGDMDDVDSLSTIANGI